MPQPITHYLVIEDVFTSTTKGQWDKIAKRLYEIFDGQLNVPWQSIAQKLCEYPWPKYSNYAGIGSMQPDVGYILGKPLLTGLSRQYPLAFSRPYPKDYTKVSDILHAEGSLDLFCYMLDFIKGSMIKGAEEEVVEKQLAFALGYESHTLADGHIHPKVCLNSDDHPMHRTRKGYRNHKHEERRIEEYEIGRRGHTPYNFGYPDKVKCHKDDSGRTLDMDVALFFNESLARTYGKAIDGRKSIFGMYGLDYGAYFGRFAIANPRHPILDAYRDYITAIRFLYEWGKYMPKWISPLIPAKSISEKDFQLLAHEERWVADIPESPTLNFSQLVDSAVNHMRVVVVASQMFLSSNHTSAREFFARFRTKIPFLDENPNIDTGLPARRNQEMSRLQSARQIFELSVPIINENHRAIDALVQ